MSDKTVLETMVGTLQDLARKQSADGNDGEALDSLLNALNISVRSLKSPAEELEPLVLELHNLIKKKR